MICLVCGGCFQTDFENISNRIRKSVFLVPYHTCKAFGSNKVLHTVGRSNVFLPGTAFSLLLVIRTTLQRYLFYFHRLCLFYTRPSQSCTVEAYGSSYVGCILRAFTKKKVELSKKSNRKIIKN